MSRVGKWRGQWIQPCSIHMARCVFPARFCSFLPQTLAPLLWDDSGIVGLSHRNLHTDVNSSIDFGISVVTNIAPIYLSELVPVKLRARAVGFTIAGSGAVSVIATVVVWASEKLTNKRQYMIPMGIQALAPVILLFLSLLLTELPTWLLMHGRDEEAKRNLTSIRGGNAALAEAELGVVMVALRSNDERRSSVKWWGMFKSENLERTICSAALLCLSQVGGQILVGTYSTVILVQSGVADPFKITIIFFLLQFAGTLVGPLLLDKFG